MEAAGKSATRDQVVERRIVIPIVSLAGPLAEVAVHPEDTIGSLALLRAAAARGLQVLPKRVTLVWQTAPLSPESMRWLCAVEGGERRVTAVLDPRVVDASLLRRAFEAWTYVGMPALCESSEDEGGFVSLPPSDSSDDGFSGDETEMPRNYKQVGHTNLHSNTDDPMSTGMAQGMLEGGSTSAGQFGSQHSSEDGILSEAGPCRAIPLVTNVCLVEALRSLGVPVPLTRSGPLWAMVDGNPLLAPFGKLLKPVPLCSVKPPGRFIVHVKQGAHATSRGHFTARPSDEAMHAPALYS